MLNGNAWPYIIRLGTLRKMPVRHEDEDATERLPCCPLALFYTVLPISHDGKVLELVGIP